MALHDSSDLQSWSEVPSIAHFCSLFRQAFDLVEFDIQEFEESLLLMGTPDDTSKLVVRLLIRLLRGCSKSFTSNINEDNYNTYLRRLFLSKREEAEEDNIEFKFNCNSLVDDDIDFPDLSLRERVLILQQLCEFRLDAPDVFDKLRNLDANSLRVDPLGSDSENITYWYFYGTRLYKEVPFIKDLHHDHEHKSKKHNKDKEKEKDKKKKKKDKKKKKKKKRADSISSVEEEEQEPTSIWSVACLTLQDWEDLAAKYKKSKKKSDRDLYETLSESFLPEIVKMFAEKEKEDKRRLLLMQPKRASNRLELKRKEQEEKDKEMQQKMDEERRYIELFDEKLRGEREQREREEQERSRHERQRQRDLMKELRAQRASEREMAQAMAKLKEEQMQEARKREKYKLMDSDPEDEDDKDQSFEPPRSAAFIKDPEDEDGFSNESDSSNESDIDGDDGELSQNRNEHRSGRDPHRRKKRSTFSNALLKAGTKSTKDSWLEKPVRKQPGLLLETAGRNLLQKRQEENNTTSRASAGLSFGLASSKISFGLYEGHLPIDHCSYTKSLPYEDDSTSVRIPDLPSDQKASTVPAVVEPSPTKSSDSLSGISATKKVFSNWGGDFFKKNLDYRANTNKILEKMNLNVPGGQLAKPANGDSVSGERFKSSLLVTPNRNFTPSPTAGLSPVAPKRSPIDGISNDGPTAKKFKTSILNSFMQSE